MLYLFVVATDMPSAGCVHSFENVIVSCTHVLVELRSLQDAARNAEKEKGKVESQSCGHTIRMNVFTCTSVMEPIVQLCQAGLATRSQ